jgi:hypothetical protein
MARLWAGRLRFDSRQEQGRDCLRHDVQTGCDAQPAYYPVGTGIFPGVKATGREADN